MADPSHDSHEEEYTPQLLEVMQLLWGDGFLSPGGEAHLAAIVSGVALAGKRVLDVGCAIGGFDVALARDYGATVVGLDVETALVEDGIRRVAKAGLEDIHAEYRAMAHAELKLLEADLAGTLRDRLGPDWHGHFVENWQAMTKVLDSGDLRPGRLRARKPEA